MISEHTIILWTMISTAGTALFTLLLAVFAWLAWRASANSLERMRDQETATREATERQIADQTWGRQIDALAEYLYQLNTYFGANTVGADRRLQQDLRSRTRSASIDERKAYRENILDRTTHRRDLERKLNSAGAIWRMLHKHDSTAASSLERAQNLIIFRFRKAEPDTDERALWRGYLVELIDVLQKWQAGDSQEKTRLADKFLRDIEEAEEKERITRV